MYLKMTKFLSGFCSFFCFCFSSKITATARLHLHKDKGQIFLLIFACGSWPTSLQGEGHFIPKNLIQFRQKSI